MDIDCGFGLAILRESVRLSGIDCAETRGGTEELKWLGNIAKNTIMTRLPLNTEVVIETEFNQKGKFGRVLATVWHEDININEMLIEERLAVRYHGQSKEEILDQHIANAQFYRNR